MPADFAEWDRIQERARKAIWYNFRDVNCLAAAAPTGFGKTRLGANLMKDMTAKRYPWVWYTHRKTLTSQTLRSFEEQGLDFGVRASGMFDRQALNKQGQIAMIQSEAAAVRAGKRQLHEAKFVVIDEAHANKEGFAEDIIKWHVNAGAKVLLLSATPVGLRQAERLILLAHLSEMFKIGALLPAVSYTVPGQDMKLVKKIASGDFGTKHQAQHFTQQQVVGNILQHYHRLQNHHFPETGAPGLGFAPCVKSSISMTDQFCAAGVKSAHIDGVDVYLGEHDISGEPVIYKSSQKMRDYVFDSLAAGDIRFIWNRFVMREGVDIPELGHVIFACSVGTPETWLQAVGRVLRAHPSLTEVVLQDHGANIARPGLGSPNGDRFWELEDTNERIIERSVKDRKEGKEPEPNGCPNPNCQRAIRYQDWEANGNACPYCGHKFKRRSHTVIEADGTLVKHYEKAPKKKHHEFQKGWTSLYFRMQAHGSTGSSNFNQLAASFQYAYPAFEVLKTTASVRNRHTGEIIPLGYCPREASLWNLPIKAIPRNELTWPQRV